MSTNKSRLPKYHVIIIPEPQSKCQLKPAFPALFLSDVLEVSPILGKRKRTYHLVSPSLTERRRRDSNSFKAKIIARFNGCFWRGWTWQVGFESFCRYAVFMGEVSERCRKLIFPLATNLNSPTKYLLIYYEHLVSLIRL